jgi:four helix bundle protein
MSTNNGDGSRGKVEDLQVFQKAVAAADAVFALTDTPAFNPHVELRTQMRTASGRIQAHLQEGAGQTTDRHYAHYVGIARGSAKEMKGHLRRARGYGVVSESMFQTYWKAYDEIAAMLTGLKRYLDPEGEARGRRP